MNQPNLAWPLLHPGDEADQVGLVRVRRVAANRIDAGADVDALAVEVDVPAFRAVSLNVPARRALALIAHEQHMVARVTQHGLEIVDDAPSGTHAVACDDDRRARRGGQVFDDTQVLVMTIHGHQLAERQRLATFLQATSRVVIPEYLQVLVGTGEPAGQR